MKLFVKNRDAGRALSKDMTSRANERGRAVQYKLVDLGKDEEKRWAVERVDA